MTFQENVSLNSYKRPLCKLPCSQLFLYCVLTRLNNKRNLRGLKLNLKQINEFGHLLM